MIDWSNQYKQGKEIKVKTKSKAIIFLALLSLSGCATTKHTTHLDYHPSKEMQGMLKTPNAQGIQISIQCKDSRVNKEEQNLHLPFLQEEIQPFVENSFMAELLNRGFKIDKKGTNIEIEVVKFSGNYTRKLFTGEISAEVILNVVIKDKKGRAIFSKPVMGAATLGAVFFQNEKDLIMTLNKAFAQAVQYAINDEEFICTLLE